MTKFKPEQLAHIYSSGKFQNTAIFSSASAANDFLSLGILYASNLTACIPDSFLLCEGLNRGVPTDHPVEKLLNNIKCLPTKLYILVAKTVRRKRIMNSN